MTQFEYTNQYQSVFFIAESVGAVVYTDCTSMTPDECLGYDTKQSDGEVPTMLGLWEIRSTPSLLLFPGPLRPGMVTPDRALSMGWIELTAFLC